MKPLSNNDNNQKISSILKKAKLNSNQNVKNLVKKCTNILNENQNNGAKFQFNRNLQNQQRAFTFNQSSASTPSYAKSNTISNLVFPQQQQQPKNYDFRDYKETNQLMKSKFNNNNQQQLQQQQPSKKKAANSSNNENSQLKVLTTTIEEIKAYQESLQKKHNFIFETIGKQFIKNIFNI